MFKTLVLRVGFSLSAAFVTLHDGEALGQTRAGIFERGSSARTYCPPCPTPMPADLTLEQQIEAPIIGVPSAGSNVVGSDIEANRSANTPLESDGPEFDLRPTRVADAPVTFAPKMMGDSTGGGCFSLFVEGALGVNVSHPTYACSRLNIAENNNAVCQDRIYYSFRHFDNATTADVFSYSPLGRSTKVSIGRHLFGFERKLGEATSLEFRLPFSSQLNSNLNIEQTNPTNTANGSVTNLDSVLNDKSTQLGNLSFILKREMLRSDKLVVSAGLGFLIPSGGDVVVSGVIDDEHYEVFDPTKSLEQNNIDGPVGTIPVNLRFSSRYRNNTTSLLPFVAYTWANERRFSQGLMQLDFPLNESTGSLEFTEATADGETIFNPGVNNANFALQNILRINLSEGRWLYMNENALLSRVGVMFEAHYSTTLNDAKIVNLQSNPDTGLDAPFNSVNLGFGNMMNRVDVLNLGVGVPILLGKTSITQGVALPVRTGGDRGFDWEYNLNVGRAF